MTSEKRSYQGLVWVVAVIVIAAAGAWYWLQSGDRTGPPPAPVLPVAEPESEPATEPQYPVLPVPAEVTGEVRPPLPSLADSDDAIKGELAEVLDDRVLNENVVRNDLITRIVATIDGLSRPYLAERIRPVTGLDESFMVTGNEDTGEYVLDPEGYARYNDVVTLLADAELDQLAAIYRWYYPLFQQAYVDLGYPQGYFNDRLVDVIDHLLETPSISDPIALVRPHVLYRFADPQIESRSAGQKLLIRMGTANANKVKTALRRFRDLITGDLAPDAQPLDQAENTATS